MSLNYLDYYLEMTELTKLKSAMERITQQHKNKNISNDLEASLKNSLDLIDKDLDVHNKAIELYQKGHSHKWKVLYSHSDETFRQCTHCYYHECIPTEN